MGTAPRTRVELWVDLVRQGREATDEDALRVDDEAQVHHVGKGPHPDDEVVFGLEHPSRPGSAGPVMSWSWAPAAHLDGVVGWLDAGVERARQCCPAEPVAPGPMMSARAQGRICRSNMAGTIVSESQPSGDAQ